MQLSASSCRVGAFPAHRLTIIATLALLTGNPLSCAPVIAGEAAQPISSDILMQWQRLSLSPPTRAPDGAAARQALSQVTGVNGTVWRAIGPSPIRLNASAANGRVNAIAVNPYNPLEIYLGAAGGGVWRTRDAGATWEPLLDQQVSLGIGEPAAIAIDPTDGDTIYVGTSGRGTLNLRRGILKSTDGGGSWVVLGSDCPRENTGNADELATNDVNVIRVDPADPNRVYLAGSGGLFFSSDAGLNWAGGANGSGDAWSLALDETSPSANTRVLHAGVAHRGVLKSMNGGASWQPTAMPGVATNRIVRISVALSPNPQVAYAALAVTNNPTNAVLVILKSTNGGASWAVQNSMFPTGGGTNTGIGATDAFLALGVDPVSPGNGTSDILLLGVHGQFRSTDSGLTFADIGAINGVPPGTHADWVFVPSGNPAQPTVCYTGNNHGLWRTEDNGAHWTGTGLPGAPPGINGGGLQISQFNSLAPSPDAMGSNILGGMVNNGLVRWTGSNEWPTTIGGGEAPSVVFDTQAPMTAYVAIGNNPIAPCMRVVKSLDGGQTWLTTNDVTPWKTTGTENACYPVKLAVDPNHAGLLYAGGPQNLWQTRNAGASWRIIGSNGPVAAVAVARVNSNRVAYAAGGSVFVITNALATNAPIVRNVTRNLPGRPVTQVAFDPNDANVLYVTLAGFSGSGASNLFRATLTAASWENISPPIDLPIHSLVLDGAPVPSVIYAGTPLGVLRSVDRGQQWTVLDDFHLPNVPVADLALHPQSGRLLAGTSGRGVFEFKEPDGPVIAVNALDLEQLHTNVSLDFGPVCLGDQRRLTLQVFNAGTEDLDVHAVYRLMGDGQFRVLPNPSTPVVIGPNEEVDFTLEYRPTARETNKAILRISSNDPTAPWVDFIVTGEGLAPLIATSVPAGGFFGEAAINSPNENCGFADLPLTINNPSACDLRITGITSSNPAEFFPPDTLFFPLVIHPGDSLELWLRFTPTSTGTRAATFTLANSSINAPLKTVAVSGRGRVDQRVSAALANGGVFGNVAAFCGSEELLLTINNSGSCALAISNIVATESAFIVPGLTNRPLVIEPGDSLPVTITYAPVVPGTNQAFIRVFSDDPVTPVLSLPVSGQALQPVQLAGVIADSGFFGTIPAGTFVDQPFTLNNAGNCPLTIAAIEIGNLPPVPGAFLAPAFNPPLVIDPGDSIDIPIRFAPPAPGVFTATITVFGEPQAIRGESIVELLRVNVSGAATSPPPPRIVTALPDGGDFGARAIGCEFHDLPLTINNAGGSNLLISGMSTLTVEFFTPGVSNYPILIHPGDSITLPIRYAPVAPAGPSSDTLSIVNNDPARPIVSLSLTGFALPPQGINAFIADGGNFGHVAGNCDFRDLPITINNTGRCDLIITSVMATNQAPARAFFVPGEFPNVATLDFPLRIAPGDSLALPIRFQPPTAGNFLGEIRIVSNGGTENVGVQGTGLPPQGINAFIADGGNFGHVAGNCDFRDLPITINNTGRCDLIITSVRATNQAPARAFFVPGEFPNVATLDYPLRIAPGDSLALPIRFQPPAAGNFLGEIRIVSNGGTESVGVQGAGLPPQRLATVVPDNGDFGAVPPCEFRDLPLTINNPGNCPLTITDLFALENLLCCTNASGGGAVVTLTNVTAMTNVTYVTNIFGSITNITATTNVTHTTNVTTAVASGPCHTLAQGCLAPLFETPSVLSFPLVVHPGDSLTVPIRFAPKTCCANGALPLGTNFGLVAIFSDDPATPVAFVDFRGVVQDGPRLATVLADDGDFGLVDIADFRDLPLTLNNTGQCDLVISDIVSLDGSFVAPGVTDFPLVIHPGDSLAVPIRFQPSQPGDYAGGILISGNDPGLPRVVPLSGIGSSNMPLVQVDNFFITQIQNNLAINAAVLNNSRFTFNSLFLFDNSRRLIAIIPIVIAPGNRVNVNIPIQINLAQINLAGPFLFFFQDNRRFTFGPLIVPRPPSPSGCLDIRSVVVTPLLDCDTNFPLFRLSFTVENRTTNDIDSLIIPNVPAGVLLGQTVISLPALLNPGQSATVSLDAYFIGALPEELCLDLVAHQPGSGDDCEQCCKVRHCFPLRSKCAEITRAWIEHVHIFEDNLHIVLQNRSGAPVQYVTTITESNCAVVNADNPYRLPAPIPDGASALVKVPLVVDSACSNRLFFRFILSDANFNVCCTVDHCLRYNQTNAPPRDFGDAPASFPVLLANGGASHVISSNLYLGSGGNPPPDAEPDGQPHPNAQGDDLNGGNDENGLLVPPAMSPGQRATMQVLASDAGKLDAWIDFNANGQWEPDEALFAASMDLVAGPNLIEFDVPASAVVTNRTFLRLRLSGVGGLTPGGGAADGEVEDHRVAIQAAAPPPELDFGDAPATYPTLLAEDGARHGVVPGYAVGQSPVDAETNGVHTADALGDDERQEDDEDAIPPGLLLPRGGLVTVPLLAHAPPGGAGGFVSVWVDFDRNFVWDETERVVTAFPLQALMLTPIQIPVPGAALPGETFLRLRFSSVPIEEPTGPAPDGEVEDHVVTITSYYPGTPTYDSGDAPAPFPTLDADNGARHWVNPDVRLGALIDAEPNGQPDANALGDDNAGLADEDGVTFLTPLSPGNHAQIEVVASVHGWFQLWVDFDGNGSWEGAADHAVADWGIGPGPNQITFAVPAYARLGTNMVRARFSTSPGLGFTGTANDGEVEDYQVRITAAPPPVVLRDWGDAPAVYGTLGTNGGPSHELKPYLFLGSRQDAEADGQPDPAARGDDFTGQNDEDGVQFISPLVPGQPARLRVIALTGGLLQAWIDFNTNGYFGEPDERICINRALAAPLDDIWFNVPANAQPGYTFLRLRLSSQSDLDFFGSAIDGEVEDHRVAIFPASAGFDLGDAPEPYPTLLLDGGAYHGFVPGTIFLGNSLDSETNGQPSLHADGDDVNLVADEDGLLNRPVLTPGGAVTLQVVAAGSGKLDGWIDFNRDRDWADAGERVFNSVALVSGSNSLAVAVPPNATNGPTFLRLRFSSAGGLEPSGPALDGEVEDYELTIASATNTYADLALTKTVNTNPAQIDATFNFRLTITNLGPGMATGVTVSDPLPANLTLFSYTFDGNNPYNDSSGVWSVAPLGPGQGRTLVLTAYATNAGTFTNAALITGSSLPDPNAANNLAAATVTVLPPAPPHADLGVSKLPAESSLAIGQSRTFTIVVNNSGPGNATNVTVQELVGAGWNFVAVSNGPNASFDSGSATWTVFNLPASSTEILSLTLQATNTGTLFNTATVSAPGVLDGNSLNDSAHATVYVNPATAAPGDLALRKQASVDGVTFTNVFRFGDAIIFLITFTNYGPTVVSNIAGLDVLPAGVSFFSSFGLGQTVGTTPFYNRTNGVWTLGNLRNTNNTRLALFATATNVGTFTNTAVITGSNTPDPDTNNNAGSVIITVLPLPGDLAVSKRSSVSNATIGQEVTFTITVSNAAPSGIPNVTLRDEPGTGWSFITTTHGTNAAFNSGSMTWTIFNLPAFATETVSLTLQATNPGALSNAATVSAPPVMTDTNSLNNLASVTVNVSAAAPPVLAIQRQGNQVLLSWSAALTDYALESTPSLPAQSWLQVTNPPVLTDAGLTVTLNVGGSNQFFRLRLEP